MHGARMGKSPKENGRGMGEIRRETMYLVSIFQVGLHRLVCTRNDQCASHTICCILQKYITASKMMISHTL